MKLSLFILSLALLAGCGGKEPASVPVSGEITRVQILTYFGTNGLTALENEFYGDSVYDLPTLDWVSGTLASKLYAHLVAEGLYAKSKEDAFDCEDYTDEAIVIVRRLFAQAGRKSPCFGKWYYTDDKVGGHAINFFFVRDGQALRLFFFEPQNQSIVSLSVTERGMVWIRGL